MRRRAKYISLVLVLLLLVCMATGCSGSGSSVDTILTFNDDMSGTREMQVWIDGDKFESYFSGTIDDVKTSIANHCPDEMSYSVSEDVLCITFTITFSSVEDYTNKVTSVLGEAPEIEISTPDSIWASGIYVYESFSSQDLLSWFAAALVEDGFVSSDYQSSILSEGNTSVVYGGSSNDSDEYIYVDEVEYLEISGIDFLTDVQGIDDYTRTVIFRIPSASIEKKGNEIDAYMESIVPSGASYDAQETTDGMEYTYTASGLTVEEIGAFDLALFGEGNYTEEQNVDEYYSPFAFTQYFNEELLMANFLEGSSSVVCSFYVAVSDVFNVNMTSSPDYIYNAASSYSESETYAGYYLLNTVTCYPDYSCSAPMLVQKTYVTSAIDVKTTHGSHGKKWTRTSVISFTEAPSEDEDSMITARLEAMVGLESEGVTEDAAATEEEAQTESTEEEKSVGTVTVSSETVDDVYQVTIKQSGTTEEMLYSSLLLFGSEGTLMYVSEGGFTKVTKTEAFAESVSYYSLLADYSEDFVLNYSMQLGLNAKETEITGDYDSYYSYDYDDDEDAESGGVSKGKYVYTSGSPSVDITYVGTKFDILALIFWIAVVLAVILIIVAIVRSGILKRKPKVQQAGGYAPTGGSNAVYPPMGDQTAVYPPGSQPGVQMPAGGQPGVQMPMGAQPGVQMPMGSQPGVQMPVGDQIGVQMPAGTPIQGSNQIPLNGPVQENNQLPMGAQPQTDYQPASDYATPAGGQASVYSQEPITWQPPVYDTAPTNEQPQADDAAAYGQPQTDYVASADDVESAGAFRFCEGCGTLLAPGAVFCENCGQKVE